uniref:Uncharacterized protein n=1 Tax=Escherichia coli TaxID=562 RepID=A0A8F1L9N3_ECOLX|nr:hypothetical protein IHCLGBEB_00182 [Escherichia coli]
MPCIYTLHRVESLVRFHYTLPVFCEAPTIFRRSAKFVRKIVGVFLLWLPEHLQSSDLLSVHAISPECLMAHSAVRLSLHKSATLCTANNSQKYTRFTLI